MCQIFVYCQRPVGRQTAQKEETMVQMGTMFAHFPFQSFSSWP